MQMLCVSAEQDPSSNYHFNRQHQSVLCCVPGGRGWTGWAITNNKKTISTNRFPFFLASLLPPSIGCSYCWWCNDDRQAVSKFLLEEQCHKKADPEGFTGLSVAGRHSWQKTRRHSWSVVAITDPTTGVVQISCARGWIVYISVPG